jgi:predicted regulator of Ras-like GTPase activity (Roadblock/LC7/MglB family)
MAVEELLTDSADGFVGAMTGVTLADVMQMNGHNRFTGCINLEYGESSGLIFFRDGEVIHAEQGELSGEAAFHSIIQWPSGKFSLEPKVTTTRSTIKSSLNHLLLESMRLMDEAKQRLLEKVPVSEERRTSQRSAGNIFGHLKRIAAVEHAVLLSKDGKALDDDSFVGDQLAAQSIYLAMIGNQIGAALALGEVKSAGLQGKSHHMLIFESKHNYLGVAVNGSGQLGSVESEIRKALAPKK